MGMLFMIIQVSCVEGYLTNRKQYVDVNDVQSEMLTVNQMLLIYIYAAKFSHSKYQLQSWSFCFLTKGGGCHNFILYFVCKKCF